MRNKLILVGVAALVSGLLTACGGDDTAAYCDSIEEAKADIESLDSADFEGFDRALDRFHELADEAPDDVADDWKVLDGALTDFEQALNDAGIEFSDLEGMASGELPEGVDQQKLATLGEDVAALSSSEFEEAANNIEKHAKDECDVDLGTS